MATIPGSTTVGGFVAPTDTEDTYPSHSEEWGRGGYRTVADTTERDAIPAGRRKAGMQVFTEADETTYRLGAGLTDADWEVLPSEASALGKVVVRFPNKRDKWFIPSADSNAARGIILQQAMLYANGNPYSDGTVELSQGGFTVPSGFPLTGFAPVNNVKITFGPESVLLYENLDDVAADGTTGMFGFVVNALNFGVDPSGATLSGFAFECARLALPLYGGGIPDEYGEPMHAGRVIIPLGFYKTDLPFKLWNNMANDGQTDNGQISLEFQDGYAPLAGPERYGIDVPRYAINPGVGLSNFTHYVRIRGITIGCTATDNEQFCALSIGAAQLSLVDNVTVQRCKRGIFIKNDSNNILFPQVWVTGPVSHGPAIDSFGSQNLTFLDLSVEHINYDNYFEDGRVIPAIRLRAATAVHFANIQGEGIRGLLEMTQCKGISIGVASVFQNPAGAPFGDYLIRSISSEWSADWVGGVRYAELTREETGTLNPDLTVAGLTLVRTFTTAVLPNNYDGRSSIMPNSRLGNAFIMEKGAMVWVSRTPNGSVDNWVQTANDTVSASSMELFSNNNAGTNYQSWDKTIPAGFGSPYTGYHRVLFSGSAKASRGLFVAGYANFRDGTIIDDIAADPILSDLSERSEKTYRNTSSGEIRTWTKFGSQIYKSPPFVAHP